MQEAREVRVRKTSVICLLLNFDKNHRHPNECNNTKEVLFFFFLLRQKKKKKCPEDVSESVPRG